jgi:hypothetical protein
MSCRLGTPCILACETSVTWNISNESDVWLCDICISKVIIFAKHLPLPQMKANVHELCCHIGRIW